MTVPKVGDRIEFTEFYSVDAPKGARGKVTEVRAASYHLDGYLVGVLLDNGAATSAFNSRMKVITPGRFKVGDRVVYNGKGAQIGKWGPRFRRQTVGVVAEIHGATYYVMYEDGDANLGMSPEHHLNPAPVSVVNPFAKIEEKSTVTNNLIGPKPEAPASPTVVLPLRTRRDYLIDENGRDVLRVLAGGLQPGRNELAAEFLRLINLGIEADKTPNVPAPKFRLRRSGEWFEVTPGHFVNAESRTSAVRQWDMNNKTLNYGASASHDWVQRHPLTEDPSAPEYVLRDVKDRDGDKWFEVEPGIFVMEPTRAAAEGEFADKRSVHNFRYAPLKDAVTGDRIPEHRAV